MKKGGFIGKRLDRLYQRRERLAKQIDKAYLRDDVSHYIALEEKYRRIGILIDNLAGRLARRPNPS